jgi:Fic family protein
MDELANIVQEAVAALDEGMELPNAQIPLRDKILYVVASACRIFEWFLRIHPYVNGNGHAARFCLWALLGRYGLWPVSWPIDPRPDDPPYTDLIVKYRNGNQVPLETFIMESLVAN